MNYFHLFWILFKQFLYGFYLFNKKKITCIYLVFLPLTQTFESDFNLKLQKSIKNYIKKTL